MAYEIRDRVMVPRDLNLPKVRGIIERINRFEGTTVYYTPEQLDRYFVRHFDGSGGWYALRDLSSMGSIK